MLKKIGLLLGPVLFLLVYNSPFQLMGPEADKVLSVALWMVVWWITEAVSISVTALIPLVLFPMLGIMDMKAVSKNYGSPIVFLFFGGFVMALALEKVGLHRRIALNIVKMTGTSPNKMILGLMIATAFLSMWISNTATTVVMLPIGLSMVDMLKEQHQAHTKGYKNFALSTMLAIAYAANVGGISTIIGTPPNSVIVGFMAQEYQMNISFLKWMLLGVPFTCLMIATIYFLLVKLIYPNRLSVEGDSTKEIQEELSKLGPMRRAEKQVAVVFFMAIFLWITRIYIADWLPGITLSDTGISMLAAFVLFAIPLSFGSGTFVLHWKDTKELPWGILILFGGGLALATGLSQAGIIDSIGNAIAQNDQLSVFLVGVLLITVMLFMTELMSNVALVAIFAPVVAGIALGLDEEILHLLIPVAMASSCAFMLPMATPPNAVVFASGHIKISEMVRAGVVLNTVSIIVLIAFMYWIIPAIF